MSVRVRKIRDELHDHSIDAIRFYGFMNSLKPKLPKQYIFNGNATILIHNDETKTIVKTMEGDDFDPLLGFLTAYFQKHSGLSKHKANEYLEEVKKKYEEGKKN